MAMMLPAPKERRCASCGRPLAGLLPECDFCSFQKQVDSDLPRPNGFSRRDEARGRVSYWKERA